MSFHRGRCHAKVVWHGFVVKRAKEHDSVAESPSRHGIRDQRVAPETTERLGIVPRLADHHLPLRGLTRRLEGEVQRERRDVAAARDVLESHDVLLGRLEEHLLGAVALHASSLPNRRLIVGLKLGPPRGHAPDVDDSEDSRG